MRAASRGSSSARSPGRCVRTVSSSPTRAMSFGEPRAERPDASAEPARRIKPVGTSSVVFKMDLAGPIDAAFKPPTKAASRGLSRGGGGLSPSAARWASTTWRPAVPRSSQARAAAGWLLRRIKGAGPSLGSALGQARARRRAVHGAAIYWIPDMHELGLDSERRRRALGTLALPGRRACLARQVEAAGRADQHAWSASTT